MSCTDCGSRLWTSVSTSDFANNAMAMKFRMISHEVMSSPTLPRRRDARLLAAARAGSGLPPSIPARRRTLGAGRTLRPRSCV